MTTWTRPDAGRAWAYAGATLGGAVSIAANVAHSYVAPDKAPTDWEPARGAVLGAVFWPVGLFFAIEIWARAQWPDERRWLAVRWLGLLPVAVFAAVVSYRHMSGLLASYGEDSVTSTFGPLAVDGLMVMATGALIATGQRRAAGQDTAADSDAVTVADASPGPVSDGPSPSPDSGPDNQPVPKATRRAPAKRTAKRTPKVDSDADNATAILAARVQYPNWTYAAIAKHVGVSTKTVSRHLPKANTPAVNGTPVTTGAP